MKQTHQRVLCRRLPVAAVAGALTLALGGGAAATAGESGTQGTATITMNLSKGKFSFSGPDEVTAGDTLRIRNAADPRRGGPHTFSLVERGLLPKSRRARRACLRPGRICRKMAVAHEVNFRTEAVGRKVVAEGERGWDTPFTSSEAGDSWFSARKGQRFSQAVSAEAGTTLYYLCAIHPEMQGSIDVVEGEETAPQ